jgi:hypothetical protein
MQTIGQHVPNGLWECLKRQSAWLFEPRNGVSLCHFLCHGTPLVFAMMDILSGVQANLRT